MQVLSFSLSRENFRAASMVLLFVPKTRVEKSGVKLGMNPKWCCKIGETILRLCNENDEILERRPPNATPVH